MLRPHGFGGHRRRERRRRYGSRLRHRPLPQGGGIIHGLLLDGGGRGCRRSSTSSSISRSRASSRETFAARCPPAIDCVVGTTGLSDEKLTELAALAPSGTCLFYAPNFTTGAVLMMEFAKAAAPYFPEAEVIEMHHCNKKDAPSGTAMRTARDHLGCARRPSERGTRGRDGASRSRRCARCARLGCSSALRALDGLRREPGGRLRIDGADAHHPPRLLGSQRPTCLAFCWVSGASVLVKA